MYDLWQRKHLLGIVGVLFGQRRSTERNTEFFLTVTLDGTRCQPVTDFGTFSTPGQTSLLCFMVS